MNVARLIYVILFISLGINLLSQGVVALDAYVTGVKLTPPELQFIKLSVLTWIVVVCAGIVLFITTKLPNRDK